MGDLYKTAVCVPLMLWIDVEVPVFFRPLSFLDVYVVIKVLY